MCLFVQYPIRDGDTVTLLLESLGAFAACWQAAPMQRTLDSPALEWRKQTGAHRRGCTLRSADNTVQHVARQHNMLRHGLRLPSKWMEHTGAKARMRSRTSYRVHVRAHGRARDLLRVHEHALSCVGVAEPRVQQAIIALQHVAHCACCNRAQHATQHVACRAHPAESRRAVGDRNAAVLRRSAASRCATAPSSVFVDIPVCCAVVCCTMLRPCCTVLRHVATCCTMLQHGVLRRSYRLCLSLLRPLMSLAMPRRPSAQRAGPSHPPCAAGAAEARAAAKSSACAVRSTCPDRA